MKGLKKIIEQVKLHVSGYTGKPESEFQSLISYKNNYELAPEIIEEWVVPFYMKIGSIDEVWVRQLGAIESEVSKDLTINLLGDYNWRSRATGAFFAGLKGFYDLSDIIGVHLLKSELTYAGKTYAYTLASFNTEQATQYLDRYLDYYLLKPDLWYDQREVLESLTYLDKINKTELASKHTENWLKFVDNKPNWSKEIDTFNMESQIELFRK